MGFGDESLSISTNSVPGMFIVNALDLGPEPLDDSDDKLTDWGARTAQIAAVGVSLPVGKDASPASGTSFASPFVASVAALMVQANPALRPDDIERILLQTSVRVGSADGATFPTVEPVAAIAAARRFVPATRVIGGNGP